MAKKFIGGISIDTEKEMRERHPADFYPTEQALIDAYVTEKMYFDGNPDLIFDVGAGDGRWGRTVKNNLLGAKTAMLVGTDIRDLPKPDGYDYWHTGESGNIYNLYGLAGGIYSNPNIYIANPPFSIADDFFELCVNSVNKETGLVAFLLPLSWLASEKRAKWYNDRTPISRIVVCNTRPSFDDTYGGSYPGREYGIFEWHFMSGWVEGRSLNSKEMGDYCRTNPIEHLTYKKSPKPKRPKT